MIELTENALTILGTRNYLRKSNNGRLLETPEKMMRRVAEAIAVAGAAYDEEVEEDEKEFYKMMVDLEFLPNSPTLMNAGKNGPEVLPGCFVMPIDDSLESIFKTLHDAALALRAGGGVGFAFSKLRPRGVKVSTTGGVSSGPVSFMGLYDHMAKVINEGSNRRAAMMAILRIDHPDIEEFITAKLDQDKLRNFNVSVGATREFMEALAKGKSYDLINPANNKVVRQVAAKQIFDLVCKSAWQVADPGMVFLDRINRACPIRHLGEIEATNPCVSAETWVMTAKGPRQVKELIGKKTKTVVDGKGWLSQTNGFFNTGRKQLFLLKTKEGFELKLTVNHYVKTVRRLTRFTLDSTWKMARELKAGDRVVINNHQGLGWKGRYTEREGYLMGLLIGDGVIKKDKVVLSSWGEARGEKKVRSRARTYAFALPHREDFRGWLVLPERNEYRLSLGYLKRLARQLLGDEGKRITPAIEKTSADFYKGFLRGLLDTDGSVQGNQEKGVSIRLAQSDRQLLQAVQRMLLRLGIFSKIYQRRQAGWQRLPNGKGGSKFYRIKTQYELLIAGENLLTFYQRVGFGNADKQSKLARLLKAYRRKLNRERFVARVDKLMPLGVEDVYDIQVPGINAFDANGFYVHNCGEQPLLPYQSCNLGHVNLAKMVRPGIKNRELVSSRVNREIDWQRLEEVVRLGVKFLDNVVEVSSYPITEIKEMAQKTRKIGLGVMGWADMLFKLGVKYDSEQGVRLAEKVAKFIQETARDESVKLGKTRGSFPAFRGSRWQKQGFKAMRNSDLNTIAPTGTVSIIAGTSSGIEPVFALAFTRKNILKLGETEMNEVNGVFLAALEDYLREKVEGKAGREKKKRALLKQIREKGHCQDLVELPERMRRVFVTSHQVHWRWHVKMQAAWQKYTDSAVSKTINLPEKATVDDVREAYLMAYKTGCKGITVYRDRSREAQVLNLPVKEQVEEKGICPECKAQMLFEEGCATCPKCGYSYCLT